MAPGKPLLKLALKAEKPRPTFTVGGAPQKCLKRPSVRAAFSF